MEDLHGHGDHIPVERRGGWISADGRVSNERERFELRRGGSGRENTRKTQYLGPRPQRRENKVRGIVLRGGLVLRWHSVAHGHTGILATGLLLLLEVLIVGHLLLLLVGHIAGVHAGTGHVALGRVDIAVSDILGGFGGHIAGIDAILVGSGVGSIQTSLDQVLALGLGDERLQLGGREGIDKASLGDDQQENLGTRKNGQLVGLLHDTSLPLGEGNMATRLVLNELDLNLAALTAGLVIIIVVVLGTHAAALGTTGVSAVTGLLEVIVGGRKLLLTNSSHVGHNGGWKILAAGKEPKLGRGPKGEGNRRYPIE